MARPALRERNARCPVHSPEAVSRAASAAAVSRAAAAVVLGAIALCWTVRGAAGGEGEVSAFGLNPYNGMQEREEIFEFAEKPKVGKRGDKWVVTFATKAACDVTVAVVGPDGKVVRHLAGGVLGKNAPWPFRQGTLSQSIEWDGKDDDGKPAPAGCKVRVSLGLDARFEKFEMWALMSSIKPLAVGKDGEVYAAGRNDTGSGGIHVFGRDGKYLRTIFPPSTSRQEGGKIKPERLEGPIAWNRTSKGDFVPRRYRFGGGYGFEISRCVSFFECLSAGAITAGGKLVVLYSGRGGAKLFLIDTRDGSCAAGDVVDLGNTATDGMAASPDGKWLYFAGRPANPWEKSRPFCHAVMRMSLEKPGKPDVFVGDPAKAGKEDSRFDGPNRVACDRNGNVYVNDHGNNRIQVFRPDGSFLKTIPGVNGLFGVSHKTGAIYLWNQASWTKNPVLTKLGGLDNPSKAAEMTIQPAWQGGQWREGKQSALLAEAADPPIVWFAGYAYHGQPFLVGIEDKGANFAIVTDLLKANDLPNGGGDVTGPGAGASLHINRLTGELAWLPIGPDGLTYSRGMCYANNKHCVFRFRTGSDGKRLYVSFPHGEECFAFDPVGGYHPLLQDGKPVIGPRMYHAQGSHLHQGPFCVAPNGDIYIGVTYSKESDAEMEKAGLPRHQGGKPSVCAPVLRVYGPDGKLKFPNALPGLMEIEGLRVGRGGAVYVVQPWRPIGRKVPEGLAAGSTYEDSRWGSLIKFKGDFKTFPIGRIEGAWEPPPAETTHEGAGMKVRITGALWTYDGVSPHSAHYASCTCMKASSDLDSYERSWVCSAQTCTVNVIDSNGNVMARLGGYGNVDDLKPGGPLFLGMPRNVAASDAAMWVVDLDHRALVKAALKYRTEETVPVP
ncbi:MAG: hypothetical protein N3A38_01185 [Planctomycetota bacterium]|nr:hypothetical protein [Planctomycetota bacterium]